MSSHVRDEPPQRYRRGYPVDGIDHISHSLFTCRSIAKWSAGVDLAQGEMGDAAVIGRCYADIRGKETGEAGLGGKA